MKTKDHNESNTITKVTESEEYYNISCSGLCCGLKKKYGIVPKTGDLLTVHTKGSAFGIIRGMELNGNLIFWKTDEELELQRLNWLQKNEEQKQQKFKDNIVKMDERYNALPGCFQKRIDKFRSNNSRFRVDYESYELFCCEQALEIANACKSLENIESFRSLKWEEQLKSVPNLSSDHSGNTFGCSCMLAYFYLSNQENVVKLHGALSPLVGSDEYGDSPKST